MNNNNNNKKGKEKKKIEGPENNFTIMKSPFAAFYF